MSGHTLQRLLHTPKGLMLVCVLSLPISVIDAASFVRAEFFSVHRKGARLGPKQLPVLGFLGLFHVFI
jgi:hypothetical protein